MPCSFVSARSFPPNVDQFLIFGKTAERLPIVVDCQPTDQTTAVDEFGLGTAGVLLRGAISLSVRHHFHDFIAIIYMLVSDLLGKKIK